MFLRFYGLREQPFGVTPNPRFLYYGASHREAMASLEYAIQSNLGFSALVAEPGMGKTSLLWSLLEKHRHSARSAFIFDSQQDAGSLVRNILLELEAGDCGTDAVVLRNKLAEVLAAEARRGKRVLVVLDEAQNLAHPVLESIRLLSNYETPTQKLVHIVLAGQPQLLQTLARPELAQLRQRIPILARIAPLTGGQTAEYVNHRLLIAGRGTPLFSQPALARIATASNGIPRTINAICFNALSLGYALQKELIDTDIIDEVERDLDFFRAIPAESATATHEPIRDENERMSMPPGLDTAATVDSQPAWRPDWPVRPNASPLTCAFENHVPNGQLPERASRTNCDPGVMVSAQRLKYMSLAAILGLLGVVAIVLGFATHSGTHRTTSTAQSPRPSQATAMQQPGASFIPPRVPVSPPAPGTARHKTYLNSRAHNVSASARTPAHYAPRPPAGVTEHVEIVQPSASLPAGTVVLNTLVDANGKIEHAELVSGDPALLRAAIEAVGRWDYLPGQVTGGHATMRRQVRVTFAPPPDGSSHVRD